MDSVDFPVSRELSRPAAWQRRLAALLEVVGIFVAGTLLARLISRGLNLGPASLRALGPHEQPDFYQLSWSTGVSLLLRYGIIFALVLAVGWWHRSRRLSDYGVTTAGHPLGELVKVGMLLLAVVGLPSLLLKFLAAVLPLGRAPQHWALIQSLDRPGIWWYLLVGSFGLVPIMEELFARGYVQTRLAEDFGAPAAILMTALFFTLSHTQYFIASVLGLGMLASLFVASIALGYVRHRSGSLLPCILAHAGANLPLRGWVEPAVLVVVAVVLLVWWRPIAEYASRLWHELKARELATAALQAVVVLAVLLAQVMAAPRLLPASAVLALAIALFLEFREKRSGARVGSG
jgi:membrane protease YdiL (CAAX protease family)